MALSRLFGGWIAVAVWLLLGDLVGSRLRAVRGDGELRRVRVHLGEAPLRVLPTVVAGGLLAWRLAPA